MRERAWAMGGSLDVQSAGMGSVPDQQGKGTTVCISIPLDEKNVASNGRAD